MNMFHSTWEECCERFFPGAPVGVCKKYETCDTPDSAPDTTTTEPTKTVPNTTDSPAQCKYKWHLNAVTNDGCSNSESIHEAWLSDQLVDRMFFSELIACCNTFFPSSGGDCPVDDTGCMVASNGDDDTDSNTNTEPPSNQCKYKWHMDKQTNSGCSNSDDVHEAWLSEGLVDKMFFATSEDCCNTFFPSSGGNCPVDDTGCVVGGGTESTATQPPQPQCKYKWHLDKMTQQKCSNSDDVFEAWLAPELADKMFFAELEDCCNAFFPSSGGACPVEDTGCFVASSDGGGIDNGGGEPDDTEPPSNQCNYRWHLDKLTQQKCSNSDEIYEGWLDPMIVDRMFFAELEDCCNTFFPGDDCQVEDTGCVVI